jgi:hypothetical protein
MSRLAEDIETLQRAADAAGLVIYPGGSNVSFPNAESCTVPADTLAAMAGELETLRMTPREYRLIGDEAVWLLRTAQLLVLYRADGDTSKVARFQRLGEYLRAAVEVDLVNARKSLGVMA